MNKFYVGVRAGRIGPLIPLVWPLSPGDAITLAVWLVALADPTREKFDAELEEALNS